MVHLHHSLRSRIHSKIVQTFHVCWTTFYSCFYFLKNFISSLLFSLFPFTFSSVCATLSYLPDCCCFNLRRQQAHTYEQINFVSCSPLVLLFYYFGIHPSSIRIEGISSPFMVVVVAFSCWANHLMDDRGNLFYFHLVSFIYVLYMWYLLKNERTVVREETRHYR